MKHGRRVTFHGAFTSKADAQRKERTVRGFIRETRIKGKRRFMVLTAKGKRNPYRVTAFAEEKKRGKVRGYGYDVLGPHDSPTRLRGTGSFYYPHLQAAKHAAAKEFLDPRVHQVAIKTHQDKEVGRLYRKRKRNRERLRRASRPLRKGNPGVVAIIPGRIEAIDYLRPKSASPAPDRKGVRGNLVPYRHAFRSSARMLALADGSVLIKPTKGGRRLWTPSGPKGWAR